MLEPDARLSYAIHVLKILEPNEVVEIIKMDLVVGDCCGYLLLRVGEEHLQDARPLKDSANAGKGLWTICDSVHVLK